MIATTKPAVGYIRMSTDRQENSPDRQRREIKALADREAIVSPSGTKIMD